MAADKKSTKTSKTNIIVDSDSLENKTKTTDSADTVSLVSSLQSGIRFDVPYGTSVRSIVIPGVNTSLRGSGGILGSKGKSILFSMPREDWELALKHFSSAPAIVNQYIRELKNTEEYKSPELQSELKEVRTGGEPVDPNTVTKTTA